MKSIFKRPNEREIQAQIDAWHERRRKLPHSEHVTYTGPCLYTALRGEAQILLTFTWLPNCECTVGVEWFGPADAPVRVPEQLLITRLKEQVKNGIFPAEIKSLPWPLRKIDADAMCVPPHALFVRTDTEANPATYLYWRTYVLARRAWRWFSVRALITLGVWGFLDWHVSQQRRWRDVFGPQRRWLKAWLSETSKT